MRFANAMVIASWFGLEARKGIEDCGIYDGSPQSCSIDFHDF